MDESYGGQVASNNESVGLSEFEKLRNDYYLTWMVHELGKFYKWSKSQIDEVYPNEASILLQFIAFEKKDELLQKQIDYYTQNLDALYISKGDDPEKHRDRFINTLQSLQDLKIQIIHATENSSEGIDDDLPDFDKLKKLKEFKQSQR